MPKKSQWQKKTKNIWKDIYYSTAEKRKKNHSQFSIFTNSCLSLINGKIVFLQRWKREAFASFFLSVVGWEYQVSCLLLRFERKMTLMISSFDANSWKEFKFISCWFAVWRNSSETFCNFSGKFMAKFFLSWWKFKCGGLCKSISGKFSE